MGAYAAAVRGFGAYLLDGKGAGVKGEVEGPLPWLGPLTSTNDSACSIGLILTGRPSCGVELPESRVVKIGLEGVSGFLCGPSSCSAEGVTHAGEEVV